MSHIHLPDGILPVWLWGAGWLVIIILFAAFNRSFQADLNKKVTVAAIFAAVMIIAQSFEIVPIAYHLNLSVVAGIFVGPLWMLPISFTVNLILALFGHGGITVVGLNTMIMTAEGTIGYLIFCNSGAVLRNIYLRGFVSTFLALLGSTFIAIGVVWLGTRDFSMGLEISGKLAGAFDMGRFFSLVMIFGSLGWLMESTVSSAIVAYLNKIRPDLLNQ